MLGFQVGVGIIIALIFIPLIMSIISTAAIVIGLGILAATQMVIDAIKRQK